MMEQIPSASAEIAPETSSASLHGVQSFLGAVKRCWHRPSLLGLELLWRWGWGIPILALLYWQAYRILSTVSLAHTGIAQFSIFDPAEAVQILSAISAMVLPPVCAVATWLLPTLAATWALASGLGRSLVLRQYDPALRSAPWLMVRMQLLYIVMLGGSFALWFACLHWAAWSSLGGMDPNLVGYFVKAIFLSLILFCFWAAVSWAFTMAPLLALLEGRGMFSSLCASVRFGGGSLRGVRSRLVETNLIFGVLRLGLTIYAVALYATPLPFKAHVEGPSLHAWYAFVTILVIVVLDFFKLARVIAFIEFWRGANRPAATIAAAEVSSGPASA